MKGGGRVGEGNGAVVPQTSGQYELGYLGVDICWGKRAFSAIFLDVLVFPGTLRTFRSAET